MPRHALDLVSLLPGLVFVAIGVVSLIDRLDVTRLDYAWFWPCAAFLLGVVVLARLFRRGGQSVGSSSSETEFMQ